MYPQKISSFYYKTQNPPVKTGGWKQN